MRTELVEVRTQALRQAQGALSFGRLSPCATPLAIAMPTKAARHADAFLSTLPNGYETVLGPEFEGGSDLSIGQWQRVALARAIFPGHYAELFQLQAVAYLAGSHDARDQMPAH